ncbi:hypothetical protein [Campylobacter jejuni]|uniref:hypothetical protein n=1 Tax=Campylobacter jejuni TaxID=197 RepID=UPI000F811841|nr:hypothetical protein [Campylobacter jejuni]RTJ18167.1 hypothetical protein C3H87_04705 [Campylobacter jejuni]RTJ44856.1 hypothetical protein C3H74_04765 [Campylobacter jejuni]
MADLEKVASDLNSASQSLQELREKYNGALDLLDNKNTEITGALYSAKSDALQEVQTASNTATSQISQLKDTSLNAVNEAKNTATSEISNKKEEHKQELETKKNEYINEIHAKANEYDIANINAQVKAMDTKITEQINGAKTELNSKIDNKVSKTGNETIAGVKTFSVPPVCSANPTEDAQLARKWYVDYGGGIKNLGNQTAPKIDLRQAQHFILTMTAKGAIGIANWASAGKSGTITVNNAQNITAFSAPFKFRVAQSGFSGTETFAYFCIASNNIRIIRT